MAQVSVTINGKIYRMACEDGQEGHLQGLAQRLDDMELALRRAATGLLAARDRELALLTKGLAWLSPRTGRNSL